MDWFKKKNPSTAASPPPKTNQDSSGSKDSSSSNANDPLSAAQLKYEQYKIDTTETIREYDRKLESLATILHDKSEENEKMRELLDFQENDMKVLLNKLEEAESQISTFKDNQAEYKRRLEVLTDCLEDLARENMKLAVRVTPSMPDDYEEERMPTRQEVQAKAKKSNEAAENAVKSISNKPTKSNINSPDHPTLPSANQKSFKDQTKTNLVTPTPVRPGETSTSISASSDSVQSAPPSTSPPPVDSSAQKDPNSAASTPNIVQKKPSTGGLVLPKKPKNDPSSTPNLYSTSKSPHDTGSPSFPNAKHNENHSSTSKKGHKKHPSNEGEFSSMASDPDALMVVLKKYKAQSELLRRDLIREKQRGDSLQESIDKYEKTMTENDKTFRENLLKEAKRRKDAEYIANILKKRVTELQFLLDEKDSDADSSQSESHEEGEAENEE